MSKIANIHFNPPKEQKNPFSKKIYINDKGKPKKTGVKPEFRIELPILYAPFGFQTFKENEGKYCVNLQFPIDGTKTKETEEALQNLYEFEEKLIDHMTFHSANYFGKTHTKDKIKAMYKPFVKTENEIPNITIRVQCYNNEFTNLTITDEINNTIYTTPSKKSPVSFIPENRFLKGEVFLAQIWASKDFFGVDALLTNVQVFQNIPIVENSSVEVVANNEDMEIFESFMIDDKVFWFVNKNHGSFIYEDINKEDDVGEECGVFVRGIPRLFK